MRQTVLSSMICAMATAAPSKPRERILATAYDLFSRRGIRDVGIDEVIEKALSLIHI